MKSRMLTFICHAMVVLTALAAPDTTDVAYSVVKMQIERLPDLRIPRSGHQAMYVGDELVVMGGHTSGFVPTATAEYFAGNSWHTVNMVYSHDFASTLRLTSGQILVFGGAERELGIGQTYTIERYDPATRTFQGFACLDKKRVYASATQLDHGKVVIAGNWHNTDCIECFDGKSRSDSVRPVTMPRAGPFVLQVADDEAIIFGGTDSHGKLQYCSTVDCFKGESFEVPLLRQWNPTYTYPLNLSGESNFVGDKSRGRYEYLVPAIDRQGQMAIIKVSGKRFDLLNTACPIPINSPWSEISYGPLIADTKAQRAYLVGFGKDFRIYVTAIDYAKVAPTGGAPVTLYYTEPIGKLWKCWVVLLAPDGDLVGIGGINESNYEPLTTVVRLHVAPDKAHATHPWHILWVLVTAIVAITAVALWGGKRHTPPADAQEGDRQLAMDNKQLIERIRQLMQQQGLYLNSDLKLKDVADELDVSTVKVSRCINAECDLTFIAFVNRYRVDHAQQMMLGQPDAKLTTVALASGFANETSFYRVFKATTGLTPKEWLTSRQQ